METTRTMDIAWRERKLLDWRLRSQYNSVIKGHWKWLNSRSAQRCHSSWLRDCKVTDQPGGSAGFWLGGSMPPCRLWRRKFWKCDYETVHSEVYLTTCVTICGQHNAIFYTCLPWFLSKCNISIENCCFFALTTQIELVLPTFFQLLDRSQSYGIFNVRAIV